MTWALSHIPKIAHFYWDQQSLPYLRYLTIYSFARFNPDWKIFLWQPSSLRESLKITWRTDEHKSYKKTLYCYREKLSSIANLSIETYDFEIDNLNGVSESDLLRWNLLHKIGGLWSDMDILFIKPIECISVNEDRNKDSLAVFCFESTKYSSHSIGIVLASPNLEIMEKLSRIGSQSVDQYNYQSVGATLINELLPYKDILYNKSYLNLRFHEFYIYPWDEVEELYKSPNLKDLSRAVGIHWFGGSPLGSKFSEILNHRNYSKFNNALSMIIGNVIANGNTTLI